MTTTESKTVAGSMFEVAEIYKNRDGEYMVMAFIDAHDCGHFDGMTIEYVSGPKAGQTATLDVKGQEKVLRNMAKEYKSLFPVERNDYFRTLGHIARYGKLHASVAHYQGESFAYRYLSETGIKTVAGMDFYIYDENVNVWGSGLRVGVPEPTRDDARLDFGCNAIVHNDDNTVWISNNEQWWRLIQLGFRMGDKQDVGAIRESIPPKYQADFDAGLSGAEFDETELTSKVA